MGQKLRGALFAAVAMSIAAVWWSYQAVPAVETELAKTLPCSVIVRTAGGGEHVLLAHGSPLPAHALQFFTTTEDNQEHAWVQFFLGAPSPGHLASLRLAPLPEVSHKSYVLIEVSVSVEYSGEVFVHAAEVESEELGEPFASATWTGRLLGGAGPTAAPGGDLARGGVRALDKIPEKPLVDYRPKQVRLGCHELNVSQHIWSLAGEWLTGGLVWASGEMLADFVGRHRRAFQWPGKRVLELGAGTGIVSMSLALERAHVLATDGSGRVCAAVRENAESLKLLGTNSSQVSCEIFSWNSTEHLKQIAAAGPWDVIVGTDLIYPQNAQTAGPALLRVLSALSGDATQALLVLQERKGVIRQFLESFDNALWSVAVAPPQALKPAFRSNKNLTLVRMSRRKGGAKPSLDPADPFLAEHVAPEPEETC